jgi:hypothetical protein
MDKIQLREKMPIVFEPLIWKKIRIIRKLLYNSDAYPRVVADVIHSAACSDGD